LKRKHSRPTFGPRLTGKSFFWHRRLIGRDGAAEMPPEGSAATAPRGKAVMADTFVERVWLWIHQTFPERQIYIRSDGRVQFFTFGPTLQATMAGLTLIFLGWIAFATVNVIFKDRIIEAKDHRFQQMQSAYENRLADLQISYDDLNGALVGAEDKFKATADELQTKQNAINGFLARKNQIEATIGAGHGAAALPAGLPAYSGPADTGLAGDSLGFDGPAAATGMGSANLPTDTDGGSGSLTMMPGPVAPQPRVAKPVKSSLLVNPFSVNPFSGAFAHVAKLAAAIFERPAAPATRLSAAYAQHPALRALEEQTARVAAMGHDETRLMTLTEDALKGDVGNLRDLVRRTGLNPDEFQRRAAAGEAMGGPDIPLDQVQVEGISDPAFNGAYLHASAVLDQLNGLYGEVSHIPLVAPVNGASFDRTSGFGARIDPFTGRYAFHPGIDFAGPWGAQVMATAAGTVVFAGEKGGYGNMVELDNGYGIHTRYGHLSTILVSPGMKVAKGTQVGRVGSTGRSTGPHVHYEIWFDNVVRNPSNFIEAGRHVL
jgi:murein DD-endopeptidase MepM/ murein hydrolase activator NlpD